MRRLLATLALGVVAATPAVRAEPLDAVPLVAGRLDGSPGGWLGCVRAVGDVWAERVDCFVATYRAGVADDVAVDVTVVSYRPGSPTVVERAVRPRTTLRTAFANGAWSVRLVTSLPSLGDVDVANTAGGTLLPVRVTDTCALIPLHVELVSTQPALAPVTRSTGTVGGVTVVELDRCATSVAVGPVSGTWRSAGGV